MADIAEVWASRPAVAGSLDRPLSMDGEAGLALKDYNLLYLYLC